MQTFEDFPVGATRPLGPYDVTRDEVIAFAEEFDPQPLHLDEEAAKASMLGGLSASGWHTCSMMMRMMADGFILDSTSQGSPGVDFVKWKRPVRPGDRLSGTMTVLEARISQKRPTLGIAKLRNDVRNQDGEAVLECEYTVMLLTREGSRRMSFWDTVRAGEVQELGSYRFEAADIRRFAEKFDPQRFHLDADAAKASVLGGLCASGWHTAAVFMRLNVEATRKAVADFVAGGGAPPKIGPSPGVTDLRWQRPVFDGDTITFSQYVTAKRISGTRHGWGVVQFASSGANQDGETVFSMSGAAFMGTD